MSECLVGVGDSLGVRSLRPVTGSQRWRPARKCRCSAVTVDQLQVGRVFLARDAAHVHAIAGRLGMNSEIQDACNLGWKLGLVLAGNAT